MNNLVIVFFIVLAAGIVLIVLRPMIKGKSGEAAVGTLLRSLPSEEYRSIHNVLLKTEKGTSQIDYVVVSVYGVFVIEVKNYTGWITGSEIANQWTQTIYHSKYRFLNPVHQNYGHLKAIKNILNDNEIPVYSIIAFPNDCTLMVKAEHSLIVHWNELTDVIRAYSLHRVVDAAKLEIIADQFKKSNIDSFKSRQEHLKEIYSEKNVIRSGICPRCGGRLIVRHGRYGDFIGCSNYPKCRYTTDIRRI